MVLIFLDSFGMISTGADKTNLGFDGASNFEDQKRQLIGTVTPVNLSRKWDENRI